MPWLDSTLSGVEDGSGRVEVRACRPVGMPPDPERRNVLAFARMPRDPRRLTARRAVVDVTELPDVVIALHREGIAALHSGDPEPGYASPARDLFVCTHGSRDRCCGRRGAALARALGRWAASRPDTHVWQTSHLGGHRLSPTLVDLPAGTCWGFMDEEAAIPILEGRITPADVGRRYRGSWGLGTAAEQFVAATAWERLGWQRYDRIVESRIDGELPDGPGVRVSMRFERDGADDPRDWVDPGGGTLGTIEAAVEVSEVDQQLSCGRAPVGEETFSLRYFRARPPAPPVPGATAPG
jgi:hypothetical protein